MDMERSRSGLFVPISLGLLIGGALFSRGLLAMPLIDSEEQAVLNGILADPAYSGHSTHYVGLSSTTPTDSGTNFTEPSGGAYARVARAATDWGAASGTAPATKSNSTVVTFAQATADWVAGADLTHFGLFATLAGADIFAWGALGTAKPVLNGDTASFAVGALVLKLGKPSD